jgi:hypothetical protein
LSYSYAEIPGQVKDVPTTENLEYLDSRITAFTPPSFKKEEVATKKVIPGALIACTNCSTPYSLCIGTASNTWVKVNTTSACQ